jgi:uncharacterized protein YfaQ (DUF2300 family)
MEYAGIVVSIIGSLIAFSVLWGTMQARIDELRRENDAMKLSIKDLSETVKQMPTKEGCQLKHGYIDKVLEEIKSQLREVLNAIKELAEK